MPNRVGWRLAGVLAPLLLCCGGSAAQDNGQPAAPEASRPAKAAPAEPAAARIEEASPPLYYLKDKSGNLQAVPGFSLEDFEALFKLQNQLTQQEQRPRYSLQQMSVKGIVNGEQAELTVDLRVLVREEHWVRVPLRFDHALLRAPAEYRGPGEQFLHFESEGEGYISWIRGQADQQHEITLKLLVPLTAMGDETRLRLLAPRATSSELKLRVPVGDAAGKVSEGATLLPPVAAGKGATELTVLGLGGDFELTWHKLGARIAALPTMLEASGAVLVRIDNRSVETEANLSVRSYGAAFDRFHIRLPDGAELVPGNPSGYTMAEIKEGDAAAALQRLVEVRLAKKTSGPVEVRLNIRKTHDMTAPGQWCDLAGLEVVGAARHSGTLAVAVTGDWQILWGPSRAIRQIDQLPQALRQQDVVAGFEYFAQPCSLSARLVLKKTRISVEPEYIFSVEADQVRLDAKLKYTVRGARVFLLDVVLPDWQIDEAGPENLLAIDGVGFNSPGVLSLPLLQPSTGQLEIFLRAHRSVARGDNALLLRLPQPRAGSVAPATVAVVAADNVELTPQSDAMVALVREQTAPSLVVPQRQQEPLFYRAEAADAVFAAGFCTHAQSVSVNVNSRLRLDEQSAQVEQRLTYSIAYEPLSSLAIDVPRSLVESGRIEFSHEGKSLAATAISKSEADTGTGPVRMQVSLPAAHIGRCELLARYPIALPKLTGENRFMLPVPLVMPAECTLSANTVVIAVGPGIVVEPRRGHWTAFENKPVATAPRELELTASESVDQVQLDVEIEPSENRVAIIVDRAWVQTDLTHAARQERAVFCFTSAQKDLAVSLPVGAAASQTQVLLDGKRVVAVMLDEGRLRLPLSAEGGDHRHVLELDYHFNERPPRGRLSIELPRLGHDAWARRTYWQLVLPSDEHLIAGPCGFTREYAWHWAGFCWGRKPLLEQTELETWTGAAHGTAPSEGTNRYLFSTLGETETCQPWTASRSWIVLIASGAALVGGLLLIYVPVSRRPGSLFALAVVLLCTGLIYPEPTLLVSQAASLGLVLTLLAGLLERGVARRRQTSKVQETAGARIEIGSTRSQFPQRLAGNHGSTQTAPAAVPTFPPEPHA